MQLQFLFNDILNITISSIMSKSNIRVEIQICSNCKSHQWCTRHNEASYSSLAMEIQKALKAHDSSIDVDIFQVGGQKMGSFQITCNGTLLFSKLQLGYFPYVPSATARIISFIEDYKNGGDLKKYTQGKGVSPHKGGQNSGSGQFSPNSPNKGQKKIKYNPDYKDPSRQENTTPFLMNDKHEQKNQNNKHDSKPEQKHQAKHEQKKTEDQKQQHHQQPKKQTKPKQQHHEKGKKETQEHHEPQKKSEPKHVNPPAEHGEKAHDQNKDNHHTEHKQKEEAHHKVEQPKGKQDHHKQAEKHEQNKHEQKKQQQKTPAQEHKQHPPANHKQQKKGDHGDFVLAENQGDKAAPSHPEKKQQEGALPQSHIIAREKKQNPPEPQKPQTKEEKYEEDFDNEEGKEKNEPKN